MKRRKLADEPQNVHEAILIDDDDDFLPSPVAKRFQFPSQRAKESQEETTHASSSVHVAQTEISPTKNILQTQFEAVDSVSETNFQPDESDFPDLLSQAAAEGFIESDSESDSDNEGADDSATNMDDIDIFEEFDGDGSLAEPQISSSTAPRTRSTGSLLDFFSSSKKTQNSVSPNAQGTLDKFFGLSKKAASAPSVSSNTNAGQKPSTAKKIASPKTPWFARPPVHKDSAPFYKRIPETTYLVDDFRFIYKDPPTKNFFLSHFHADHYGGLNNKFDRGMILCSQITANLLRAGLGVAQQYIRALPMNTEVEVDTGVADKKCKVTLIDANHCPGAVCFLFKLPSGRIFLHTGDFRFDPEHPEHQMLTKLPGIIDNVYLDTTYCNQNYNFPPQRLVVQRSVELMKPHIDDPRTVIIVGAYTIGKERIFLQAAEKYNQKVLCSNYKFKILSCLCLPSNVSALLTKDDTSAKIHVVPIGIINLKGMEKYLRDRPRWKRVVAFKPTGWTFDAKAEKEDKKLKANNGSVGLDFAKRTKNLGNGLELVIYDVPYSEHSSFGELRQFVRTVKSRMLIPTVNNYNGSKVKEMLRLLRENNESV